MKKYSKTISVCVAVLFYGNISFAQSSRDTVKNMGDENIIVVKDYQPTLSDATKISGMPGADTSTFADPNFTYNIEPKKTETNFNAV